MAAYAFSTKGEAQAFADKKNKTATNKFIWLVKPLSGGYVALKRPAGTKKGEIKNIRLNP